MTEKQFTYIKLGDRDEIQDYIIDNNQNNHFKHKEYHFNNISDFEDLFDMLNNLVTENEQLKQRNNNQYQQLNELWQLIEEENWEALTEMDNQMKKEEVLRNEWKYYEWLKNG